MPYPHRPDISYPPCCAWISSMPPYHCCWNWSPRFGRNTSSPHSWTERIQTTLSPTPEESCYQWYCTSPFHVHSHWMKATNDGKNEGLFISKQVSFLQVGFSHNTITSFRNRENSIITSIISTSVIINVNYLTFLYSFLLGT